MIPIPPVLTTAVVLRLQGTIGNREVCRLLRVTPPGAEPEPEPEPRHEPDPAPFVQPDAQPVVLPASPQPSPTASLGSKLASVWRRFSDRHAA